MTATVGARSIRVAMSQTAAPSTPPLPADPERAAGCMARWEELTRGPDPDVAAAATDALAAPERRMLLNAMFGSSPYLTSLAFAHPRAVRRFFVEGPDAAFDDLMATLATDLAAASTQERLMSVLRIAKRRASLVVAMADLAGLWSLAQVTGALTQLAEAAVAAATDFLLRRARAAGDLVLPDPERPAEGSGLVVLAMGKLGARELNYSSDIDLIVFYDDARAKTDRPDHLQRTFVRIARELVRIMDERTADGYVFRADLRLRPDPSATPPAVSVTAAEIYYGSMGQNWERAAMIKARPIAGDPIAARSVMQILGAFAWRRSLDFAAIQDIHSIKRQIHAHRGHRLAAVEGHNVKIGRGGIREIEFYAQTQQLIFGGRDGALRAPPTLAALRALTEAGHVEPDALAELTDAYEFLRRLEHRLQMVDDQQTHELPKTAEGVARIAAFMGFDSADDFRAALLGHLQRVQDRYAALFEEAPSLSAPGNLVFTGTDDDPSTLETLRDMGFSEPSVVSAAVRAWHAGRYRATRSQRARELLTELIPTLLQSLAGAPHPDAAFVKFDEFLARLPTGVQLFSLIYANPSILDLIAEIMGTAPRLADHLARRPDQLDAVLAGDFFGPLADAAALRADMRRRLAVARDFEDVLSLSRRWVADQQFQAGVQILRGAAEAAAEGPFLSDVAETALSELLPHVEAQFAERHGRVPGATLAILAMGKLGGREMAIGSDIDLILVYDAPANAMSDGDRPLAAPQYFARLCQRFVSAVTAQAPEGRLYEVDMRLRPSGNAGPLATAFDGFVRYQTREAWTWEHMALTRARPVAGDAPLKARLEAAIREILAAPRDSEKLLRDVADMRARIARERPPSSLWDLKDAPGGFVDVEFVAQYLQLRHAAAIGAPRVNTAEALRALAEAGFLAADAEADLRRALRLLRRAQAFLRVAASGKFDPNTAPEALKARLARILSDGDAALDFPAARAILADALAKARARYEQIVAAASPATEDSN